MLYTSSLEPRRRIDQELYAGVMEADVHGVSTRNVDDLAVALGFDSGISTSEVSRIGAGVGFRDADEQREPAQLHVGADAVPTIMEHRPQQPQGALSCRADTRSTASSCLSAAASSSEGGVVTEVCSSHVPFQPLARRCASGRPPAHSPADGGVGAAGLIARLPNMLRFRVPSTPSE